MFPLYPAEMLQVGRSKQQEQHEEDGSADKVLADVLP